MRLYLRKVLVYQSVASLLEEFHFPTLDLGDGYLTLEPEDGEFIRDVRAVDGDGYTCSFVKHSDGTIAIYRRKPGRISISVYFDQPSARVQAKIVGYGNTIPQIPRAVLYGCGVCGEAMTECFCFSVDRPLADFELAKYTGMSSAEFKRQLEGE